MNINDLLSRRREFQRRIHGSGCKMRRNPNFSSKTPSIKRVNYHRWVVSLIEKIKSMSGGKLDFEIQFFENHMKTEKSE